MRIKAHSTKSMNLVILGLLALAIEAANAQNTFPTTGNVGIGTTAPHSPVSVVSQQTSSNTVLTTFLNPSLPNGGITQLQFGQAQGENADGTLIYTFNSATPPHSYVSLGTYNHSFSLNVTGYGSVGIGTSTPGIDLSTLPSPPSATTPVLEVAGNVAIAQGSGGQFYFQDGTIQATAWNGILSGGDYAESVDVSGDRQDYTPGDVLVIDPDREGQFVRSSTPYSTAVTGIYSTKPGVIGRRQLPANTREQGGTHGDDRHCAG